MAKFRVACVVGTRPNIVKLAALYPALAATPTLDPYIIHTGQHWDAELSGELFRELAIPKPEHNLAVGSGSHAEQTAKAIEGLGRLFAANRPDCVLVVGDTNATLAGALCAAKLHIPVAHVEAGLRSGDRRMAEEINRVVTDSVADWLFTSEWAGEENLLREGHHPRQIFDVGNVMVDTLLRMLPKARRPQSERYALLTLHRAELTDNPDALGKVLARMAHISREIPVIFPAHPRTRAAIERGGLDKMLNFFDVRPPLGYLEFLGLEAHAKFIVTDSGGVQEEATALRVPCLTVRNNTERPVTVEVGSNTLVGERGEGLIAAAEKAISGQAKYDGLPRYWDGKTSERVARILAERLGAKR